MSSLDQVVHRDQALPILTQALAILALSPVPLSEAISTKIHSLACRHYGRRRPGYETYNGALTCVLLKTEPERYLEKCLASPYPAAQAEALAHVSRQFHPAPQHHMSLLLQIASASETILSNRVATVEILAKHSEVDYSAEDLHALIEQYRFNNVPAIRQALLPLLAKAIDKLARDADHTFFIRQEVIRLAGDESSASRESACRAMSSSRSWLEEQPFKYGLQLLQFLQDDDVDVRILAGHVTSEHFAQGQSLCTSRAIELAWNMCLAASTKEDVRWLCQDLFSQLLRTTEDAEAGSQMLFAVERSNMHIDITTNLSSYRQLLSQYSQSEQHLDESLAIQVASCRGRLGNIIRANSTATHSADQHEVKTAYTFVQASLLAQTIDQKSST